VELRERLAGGNAPTTAVEHQPAAAADTSFVELKDRIHMAVISELGPRLYNEALSHAALRDVVLHDVRQRLAQERGISTADRERLTQEIANDTLGHGPIEPLLQDDTVNEVMVNGPSDVWVERAGRLEKTGVRFTDEHHLRRIINKIVAQVGRRVDESSPMVDARLPDGSRVNAVLPPLSLTGPLLTIRKFSKRRMDLGDMVQINSLTAAAKDFLEAAIEAELNILISGGTGSGKTTLLNALSSAIPEDHRIVTIEDAAELRLNQAHVLRLEARPKNVEGQGEVPIRELVRNALRMRPDRIVVGEVRGSEALDMLQAMNTGHDGSLSTCHANTPRDAVARVESMVLMAGIDFPMSAIRQQLSRALDLIVQIERFNDGARRITNITEVQRMEGDTVTLQDIFEYRIDKESGDGKGQLYYTGLRPTCGKFERNGIPLPGYMDAHNFSGGSAPAPGQSTVGAVAGMPQANFGIRPGRVERRFGR
jgi:pilus assembly protein CpaF